MDLQQNNRKLMVDTVLGCADTLHFAGAGGISMSSLALWAKTAGYKVTGSDAAESALTKKLERAGIPIIIGQKAENVDRADVVIYSAALSPNNPELVSAKRQNIPCLSRAEFLGHMMSFYKARIGISGTHGKSTTTAMLACMFMQAGADPTIACGAVVPGLHGASRVGGDRGIIVYEACEYRDSFLSFAPTDAVITNIEYDHTDYFPSLESVISSFSKSIMGADTVYVNVDCAAARRAIEGFGGEIVTISLGEHPAEFSATDISYTKGRPKFTITRYGKPIANVELPMIGQFNIYNALCAAAVAYRYNIPPSIISLALSNFSGVERRFEFKGEYNGIDIYDDYAHHPDEINATVSTLPSLGYENVWLVFQPHTYSRTHDLWDRFGAAFWKAKKLGVHVILADIYAARETDTLGVSSKQLAEFCGATWLGGFENIIKYLKENAKDGDLILTMGAGQAYKIGDRLLAEL